MAFSQELCCVLLILLINGSLSENKTEKVFKILPRSGIIRRKLPVPVPKQPHSRDVIQEESDVNNQMRFWQLHRSLCNEHFKRRNVSINLPLHSRLRCNSNRPMDTVRPSYSGYQNMQDRGISEHQMTTGEGQSVPHPNTFYDFQDISRGPYPQNMKIFQQMPPVGSELQKAASNQENLLYQHFHEINLHGLPDLNANENLQAGHASECCPVARDMLSKYICNLQAALREVETGESYQQPTGAIQHPPSRLQDYERHNDFLTLQSTESVQNQDDPLEIDGIYLCRNEQGELEALVDVEAYCENISDDLEILDDDIMQEIIANNSCSEAENYVKQTKVYCDTVAQNLFHSTCFDLLFQKCQEPLTVDTRGHEYNLERNLGRPYYSDVPVLIRYDQAQNMQPEVYQNAQLPQYDDQPSQSADGTNTVSAEDLESSILDSDRLTDAQGYEWDPANIDIGPNTDLSDEKWDEMRLDLDLAALIANTPNPNLSGRQLYR